MNSPLSSLEKFGALSRKFLHDTSNDFTAIALNIHFLEKAIEPENPAYKDFQNLAVALKSLQHNTRSLLNWRRQLPDPLQTVPVSRLPELFAPLPNWTIQAELESVTTKNCKVCPSWLQSLMGFLAAGPTGEVRCELAANANDQCATNEQVNLIFKPGESKALGQLPEIGWSVHRELAKLMGGGITLDPVENPTRASLFLPVY